MMQFLKAKKIGEYKKLLLKITPKNQKQKFISLKELVKLEEY